MKWKKRLPFYSHIVRIEHLGKMESKENENMFIINESMDVAMSEGGNDGSKMLPLFNQPLNQETMLL